MPPSHLWRPEYLRKKFEIVAVSERLNLEKAGVKTSDFGERVIFEGTLNPKTVQELAEILGTSGC